MWKYGGGTDEELQARFYSKELKQLESGGERNMIRCYCRGNGIYIVHEKGCPNEYEDLKPRVYGEEHRSTDREDWENDKPYNHERCVIKERRTGK